MPWNGVSPVAAFSHGVAAFAFGLLAIWLLWRSWRTAAHHRAIAVAAILTMLWAACATAGRSTAADVAETLRTCGWLLLLLLLSSARARLLACASLPAAAALMVAFWPAAPALLRASLPLASSVFGMLLVEHVYRNAPQNTRWGIKYACLGIGALFCYDFYLYSDAMLLRRVNPDIWAARGVINALSAPMLAVAVSRGPVWTPALQLSRQIMFHSAALLGAAAYLMAMALSAWYLRYVGGAWGALMQMACLCGSVLLLAAVLFSGATRARLKLFISKHFYQGRYDYREEWQRFTRALANDTDGLAERAIQAMAVLVESPAGTLWLRREDGHYRPAARWNWPLPQVEECADSPLCQLLANRGWVVDMRDWRLNPERYQDSTPPAWSEGLWLVIPLLLDGGLFGFTCLAPPRVSLHVNWEVRDVLKIAGSQAASYLSHRTSAERLAIARQFESFSRMSTFIVHDLKNLIAQLSLLLANAEKHKTNPAFQQDMLETLSHSLGKMKHLLHKLRQDDMPDAAELLNLEQLLKRAVQAHAGSEPKPSLECGASELTVLANWQRLERVVGHLIQNAIDATPRTGSICLRAYASGGHAIIEVSDTGKGMSEQFVRERLFQPFSSTKASGMGIGVFESREYLLEVGGQLQASSAPSEGTTFRITLPLYKEFEHGQAQNTGG
ncbi:PEP-CTERM system histidine kinase PrsK [Duganella sp. sic0402]|uniref:XrtA/PEP-CTERM system histidine kinase PrsK n=1 Tax=Duganella sp. sic0402 TaxID=2854786 RepID=UPI001C480A83|nr:XrtA/PEP-CTERM system histidine kinase PrsK [Duganella sp. sic0402]MBV7534783.1 PEP-CTERM system histidine kinase PrsK [Duganella sp. sic0402]